ncbi:MAG: prenyl protease-related protein [Verrucomicrobiaceae bacterium]|nr:prenyl protease-related protein [Verrucomicrobiaceae bacterium]
MSIVTKHHWTQSPPVPYVAPLVIFMLLSATVGLFQIDNSALPWYQRAPEHWVYPLQCLIVGAVLLFFRKHYTLKPWRGLGLASVLAVVGIAVWILPATLYDDAQPAWREWLGMAARDKGFDPNVFPPHSSAWWTTVSLRFVRMGVIVPFVEELFWRGFLMRYVQAGGHHFRTVPFGQHSWKAFWIVTLAVTLLHQPADYLGAFVWGSLVYWLAVRTRSLGACVFIHAVGNGLLGLYVMYTQKWGFW